MKRLGRRQAVWIAPNTLGEMVQIPRQSKRTLTRRQNNMRSIPNVSYELLLSLDDEERLPPESSESDRVPKKKKRGGRNQAGEIKQPQQKMELSRIEEQEQLNRTAQEQEKMF